MAVTIVRSFTDSEIQYEVDLEKKTCTCPAWRRGMRPCKHVISLLPKVEVPVRPEYRVAASAFIKAVRLRYVEDAIYWLVYLWDKFPEYQTRNRVTRRGVLCTAEDGVNLGVQKKAIEWYRGQDRNDLLSLVTEVLRLCATPNWWSDPWGREYILTWRRAEQTYKEFVGISLEVGKREIVEALKCGDVLTGIQMFEAVRIPAKKTGYDARQFVTWLLSLAEDFGKKDARTVLGMFLANYGILSWDINHLSEGFFRLFVDRVEEEAPVIGIEAGVEAVEQAMDRWENPGPVPSYYLDGVHTVGSDRRFAGIGMYMAGCCLAYQKFGRLSPEDKWSKDIWEVIR